jgi:hypothetical protein
MLAGSETKSSSGILTGMGLCTLAAIFSATAHPVGRFAAWVAGAAAVGFWFHGFWWYVKGKGYAEWHVLLAVLGPIGWAGMHCMPDRFECCDRNGWDCTHTKSNGRSPRRLSPVRARASEQRKAA